ncbi:MAG: HD-GYP domain-containing protein [Actinomycetota bacterium]
MNEFPKRLRFYAAGLIGAAAAGGGALGVGFGAPQWTPLLILGALVIYCSDREVRLPNGTFVSPGLMVSMAAVVVFVDTTALVGPLIVGMLSGVYLRNLNRKTWAWIPFNAGVTGIGILVAAVSYWALPDSLTERMPVAIVGAMTAAVAYSVSAWALVMVSYLIEHGEVPSSTARELPPLLLQTLPFAVLGFFVGHLYLELGAGVMLLIIVPILIAREMFASYLKVKESHDETVAMLIHALEQKDAYTSGHSERVATYAQYMGEEFKFTPSRMERLRFAALMHDIGKLVVPNHLLNKPGKLTEEEFTRVRLHEKVSVQMLSHIDFLRPIAAGTHSDNARFDPDDADHPIEPYMVMIADAYDAMTSTRSYRKALSQEVAFQELRDKAGTQFHPQCVEALIHAIEKRGERHGAGYEAETEFENAPEAGLGSAGLGDLLESQG